MALSYASPFDQSPFRVRLAWGKQGALHAAAQGDLLLLCDVLRFSSAAVTAAANGGLIYPCRTLLEAAKIVREQKAVLAVSSAQVPHHGQYSLSPQSFLEMTPGEKVVLPSRNGSVCASLAETGAAVWAGCLLNAEAAGREAQREAERLGKAITVLACGERGASSQEGEETRFALEDYLGAGAILNALSLPRSPEAEVCAAAFQGVSDRLEALLRECGSGQELRSRGLEADVVFAAQWNRYWVVPKLENGAFSCNGSTAWD